MAKKKKGHGKKSGIPSVVKTLLTMGLGGIVGEIISPVLPAAVSGPALGIAAAGLLTKGASKRVAPYVVAGLAVQAVKTASGTKPVMVAKASVSGASKALAAGAGANTAALAAGSDAEAAEALELARRAAQGG